MRMRQLIGFLVVLVGIGGAGVGGVAWYRSGSNPSEPHESIIGPDSRSSKSGRPSTGVSTPDSTIGSAFDLSSAQSIRSVRGKIPAAQFVSALAAIGDRAAYRVLIDAYIEWANEEGREADRQSILEVFASAEDAAEGFHALLSAVAGDPTQVDADPLFGVARQLLGRFWEDPRFRQQGEKLLVVSQSTKARRLLASSICDFARDAGDRFPVAERHVFASHLVDLYSTSEDSGFRNDIRTGIAMVSDERIALALSLSHDSGVLERERRALGADPDGAVEAVREATRTLVSDACRPDVTYEAFASSINTLKVLAPGELPGLRTRAPILERSAEARALWESAMREQ